MKIIKAALFLLTFISLIGLISAQLEAADTDGDGLLDDWEINGYDYDNNGVIDVNLPAMGANPNHKDIFVEIDWMVAATHNHLPNSTSINNIIIAFANAPVSNPDGISGINIHIDTGNLGGGNALAHSDNINLPSNGVWPEFDAIKNNNFSVAREEIFHYCLFIHNKNNSDSSGQTRGIPHSDFVVSLGEFTGNVGTMKEQAGTLMHELGHNLGLRHGGNENTNRKSNYLSVMSFLFQTKWFRFNGSDSKLDYSRFSIKALNENTLNELKGLDVVGGDSLINGYGTRFYDQSDTLRVTNSAKSTVSWDGDLNPFESNVTVDINTDDNISTLNGNFNDWDNLIYDGGAVGAPGIEVELVVDEDELGDELTFEENEDMDNPVLDDNDNQGEDEDNDDD